MDNYIQGRRCGQCIDHATSRVEKDLFGWVKSMFPDAVKLKLYQENANKKFYYEYDVYIPSNNLAIELDGLYWHKEREGTDPLKSNKKRLLAQSKGIRLITIFEDEWRERQEQVKGFLLSLFNKNETKLMARKCTIKTIEPKLGTTFMDENHIQGSSNSIIYFGLFYLEKLVGVISGSKHHRNTNTKHLVLNRLCFL